MTPIIWGMIWLALALVAALIIGRAIRLADDAQERALAKRSGRHPSAVKFVHDETADILGPIPDPEPVCPADPSRPACCSTICTDYGRPGAIGLG